MEKEQRILLVDDDKDMTDVCSALLTGKGYEVTVLDDAAAIQEKLGELQPDLIFLDHRIGNANGISVLMLLKSNERFRHIPVIMLSAHRSLEQISLQAGADAYLCKPFEIEDMLQVIGSVNQLRIDQ